MEVKVKLSNLRTSPRKVREVIDLVRGKKVSEAQTILSFTVNKSARPVLKLLNSAVASAKHDLHLEESNLFVSSVTVDEGPKLKRWHPMSRGRAYPIIKRSSHIVLIVGELKKTDKEVAKETKKPLSVKKDTPVVEKETKEKKTEKTTVKKEVKSKRKTIKK